MDVITEILESCSTNEADLFTAFRAVLPIDYYIPLIGHTFSEKWVVYGDRTYRRSLSHTYETPIKNETISPYDRTIKHQWFKSGIVRKSIEVFTILRKKTWNRNIYRVIITTQEYIEDIEYKNNYTTRLKVFHCGQPGIVGCMQLYNDTQIKEWLHNKHNMEI